MSCYLSCLTSSSDQEWRYKGIAKCAMYSAAAWLGIELTMHLRTSRQPDIEESDVV